MTIARRATRLSFTKLSLFEFCPTAYRYRYVERVPVPFVPRIVVGAIVHAVLHRLFERLQARERVDKSVLDGLHADYWAEAPRLDRDRFPEMWRDGQALLDGYWSANHANLGQPVLLESRFRFRPDADAGYSIEGVIDRVDETPSGTAIIDYKSGRRPERLPDRLRAQLHTYALGVEQVHERRVERLDAYFLADNAGISITPDPDYSDALLDRYANTADRVEAASFTATPGPHCDWCDFRDRCPFRATDA
ncbi:MAG: PD-(D/E)XK nuclease family protein [Chloroflexi bacterium]|nr:PD-(D/E)XK nuclease family protein [Chloroflexota bacterium]